MQTEEDLYYTANYTPKNSPQDIHTCKKRPIPVIALAPAPSDT